jgi:septum formation protein
MASHKSTLNIILGSSSKARAKQLDHYNIPFEAFSPNVDESLIPTETCKESVTRICKLKQSSLKNKTVNLLITADQMLEVNGNIIGKSYRSDLAINQLIKCRGQTGKFHTCMMIWSKDHQKSFCHHSITHVKYRSFSPKEIEKYVLTDKPEHCAGSIKIESLGMLLMDSLTSDDPSAIIGLPMLSLFKTLSSLYPNWWLDHCVKQ